MRKAEKELNQAHVAQQQAEKAINQNDEPQRVQDLVNDLQDAVKAVLNKEVALTRVHEYYHLLDMDFQSINEKREEVLQDRLAAEVEKVAGELEELKGFFATAEEEKKTWDAEDARLRKVRTDMDAADSTADEAAK